MGRICEVPSFERDIKKVDRLVRKVPDDCKIEVVKQLHDKGMGKEPEFWTKIVKWHVDPKKTKGYHPVEVFSRVINFGDAELISKYMNIFSAHPLLKHISRGYLVNKALTQRIIREPGLLNTFLKTSKILEEEGIKLGKRSYKSLLKRVDMLRSAEMYGVDLEEVGKNARDVLDFVEKVKDRILKHSVYVPEELINWKKVPHSISMLEYYVLNPRLSKIVETYKDPVDLFRIKFQPYGVGDEILKKIREINRKNLDALPKTYYKDVERLKEATKMENLFRKKGSNTKERRFLKRIRRLYWKLVERPETAKVTEGDLKALENDGIAQKLGLENTIEILRRLTKMKVNPPKLKISEDVYDIVHYTNVLDSCLSSKDGGLYLDAAILGPVLMVAAVDADHNVKGRVSLIGYEKDGKLFFVPNKSYGVMDILHHTIRTLNKHGIEVHHEIDPPAGAKPAAASIPKLVFFKDISLSEGKRMNIVGSKHIYFEHRQ